MITAEFELGNKIVIVIAGDVLIASDKHATLRINLKHALGDQGTIDWLQRGAGGDEQTWIKYALEKAEPELTNEFNASAWDAYVESTAAISSAIGREAAVNARECGYRCWIAYLETELFAKDIDAIIARQGDFWPLPQHHVRLLVATRAWAREYSAPSAPKTIEQVATACWQAQDACNLSGLVRSWGQWLPVINAHEQQHSIEHNTHPINQVMADKIRQLARIDADGASSKAYSAVMDLAKIPG